MNRMKYKKTLLALALISIAVANSKAQAVILPILADTHIAAANAGTLDVVNINHINKGLLKFNMSTLPAGTTSSNIAKATLVFYVKTLPTNRTSTFLMAPNTPSSSRTGFQCVRSF
jgi:hypothetical protein